MSLNTLPREILTKIISETSVGAIDNVTKKLSGTHISSIIYDRNNPHIYLRRLTPRTTELLKYMRESTVILSGSRGAGMFYPDATTNESDYDFYCYGSLANAVVFILRLESLGAKLIIPATLPHANIYPGIHMVLMHGILNRNKIQVMYTENMSPIHHVLYFHSTITQCFITGYCAISLYHRLSSSGLNFVWSIGNNQQIFHANPESCVEKYASRGFKVTNDTFPHKSLSVSYPESEKQIVFRQIGDSGSKIIDFKPYLPDLSDTEKELFDEVLTSFKNICWSEIYTPTLQETIVTISKSTIKLDPYTKLHYLLQKHFEPICLSVKVEKNGIIVIPESNSEDDIYISLVQQQLKSEDILPHQYTCSIRMNNKEPKECNWFIYALIKADNIHELEHKLEFPC